jgi:hypothetical protein
VGRVRLEHLLEAGESTRGVIEPPLEHLAQPEAKRELRRLVAAAFGQLDLRVQEVGQLLVLPRALQELRECHHGVGVPGLLVEDRSQRRRRLGRGLEGRLLETREIEPQRGPGAGRLGHVDQALEELPQLARALRLLVERAQLGRCQRVSRFLFEDLLVEGDRLHGPVELVLEHLRRALLQLDDLRAVTRQLGAPEEQLHHLRRITRELTQSRQLFESPSVRLVLEQDVAKNPLGEVAVSDRLLGEPLRLPQELPLRPEIRFQLRPGSQRPDEILLPPPGDRWSASTDRRTARSSGVILSAS